MLIRSETQVGFQCPACGRIQTQTLSVFSFGDAGTHQILCSDCGYPAAELVQGGKNQWHLRIACGDCFDAHDFAVKRGALWYSRYRAFVCPQTDEMIFVLGDSELVTSALEENFYLEEEDMEDTAVFLREADGEERAAMEEFMAVIAHFQRLAQADRIVCDCGQPQIQLRVSGTCLDLQCAHCGRRIRLEVSTVEQMQALRERELFQLH